MNPSFIGTISDSPYQVISYLENGYQSIVCYYFPALCQFSGRNVGYLLALFYLCLLWAVFRPYSRNINRITGPQKQRFDTMDLAAIKVIKDNAAWVWERNRPGRKVIRLDDWRFQ